MKAAAIVVVLVSGLLPPAAASATQVDFDVLSGAAPAVDIWADSGINPVDPQMYAQYGDADRDGDVDLDDFVVLKSSFGSQGLSPFAGGDFDGSGAVDLDDFVILKTNFGLLVPPTPDDVSPAVPEPMTMAALAAGVAMTGAYIRRRRTT